MLVQKIERDSRDQHDVLRLDFHLQQKEIKTTKYDFTGIALIIITMNFAQGSGKLISN